MWRQTAVVSTALLCVALLTLIGLIAAMPLGCKRMGTEVSLPLATCRAEHRLDCQPLTGRAEFLCHVAASESFLGTVSHGFAFHCRSGLGYLAACTRLAVGDRLRAFNLFGCACRYTFGPT